MPNPLHTHLKCMYVFICVIVEYFHSAGDPPKKRTPNAHMLTHTHAISYLYLWTSYGRMTSMSFI